MTLEPEFWDAFRACAKDRGLALNALASEIDAARLEEEGGGDNLSGAIRVYILKNLQARLAQ